MGQNTLSCVASMLVRRLACKERQVLPWQGVAGSRQHLAETRALVHDLHSMHPELVKYKQRLATLKRQNGEETSSYSSRRGYQSSLFLASEK